jgi:hypothetical protein
VINLLLCFCTAEILGAPKGSTTINIFSECTKVESFLPFGSGSRACVGQKFFVLAISMLIASLLRNYEVRCTGSFSSECAKVGSFLLQIALFSMICDLTF